VITVEAERQRALSLGAFAHLRKPVNNDQIVRTFDRISAFAEAGPRKLLLVEDDQVQRMSLVELIGNGDVTTTAVATGEEALKKVETEKFDCLVLDLKLPDMSGFELIDRLQSDSARSELPIIIYTGKELTRKEEIQLKRVAASIIIKQADSPERLLAETSLFLHRVEANMPPTQRKMLEDVQRKNPVLAGRKVLIVDDDVRNIFALTSVLERYDLTVMYAEDGRQGIELLKQHPEIDVVLMDIMMPEMDGYETIRYIRRIEKYRDLPIIALTAKAMQADREECLRMGATEYLSKPVDTDQLLSALRIWLAR
jgi:CheY-like chemotaxis protein